MSPHPLSSALAFLGQTLDGRVQFDVRRSQDAVAFERQ
jgi:hypothetical protein